MAATHTALSMQSNAVNAASSSTVSLWYNLGANYQTIISAKVINTASAPTTGCTVSIDVSPDNGNSIYPGAGGIVTSGSGAGATFAWDFDVSGLLYARTTFSGNIGNSVIIQADAHQLTGI